MAQAEAYSLASSSTELETNPCRLSANISALVTSEIDTTVDPFALSLGGGHAGRVRHGFRGCVRDALPEGVAPRAANGVGLALHIGMRLADRVAAAPGVLGGLGLSLRHGLGRALRPGQALTDGGHQGDSQGEADVDRPFAAGGDCGGHLSHADERRGQLRAGDVLGQHLEDEVLPQLGQAPEEDLVLLQRQIVLRGISDCSVFRACAAAFTRVRMSEDGGDEAAARGDEIQVPAQPVLVGGDELGLVEVRHDPFDGGHALQGVLGGGTFVRAFSGGPEVLHQADMFRGEDPGIGSHEVDIGVVDAAHGAPHLAKQVVILTLGDRDDVHLLKGHAAVVGCPALVPLRGTFRDLVPGVAELSIVDLQAIIMDGQHGVSIS